jgi:hypothetical protein
MLKYICLHIPSNKIIEREADESRYDLLEKVNHWNSLSNGLWLYWVK